MKKKLSFYNELMENPITRRKVPNQKDISGYELDNIDKIIREEVYNIIGPYGEYDQPILSPDLLNSIQKEKLQSQAEKLQEKQRQRKKAIRKMTFEAAKNLSLVEAEEAIKKQKAKEKNFREIKRPKQQKQFEKDIRKYLAELGKPRITNKKKIFIINKINELNEKIENGKEINRDQINKYDNYQSKIDRDITNQETEKLMNDFEAPDKIAFEDIIENEAVMREPKDKSPQDNLLDLQYVKSLYMEPMVEEILHQYGPTPYEHAEYYQAPAESVEQIVDNAIIDEETERLNRRSQEAKQQLDDLIRDYDEDIARRRLEKQVHEDNLREMNQARALEERRLTDSVLDLTDEGSLAHELRQVDEYISPSGEFRAPYNIQELEEELPGSRHPRYRDYHEYLPEVSPAIYSEQSQIPHYQALAEGVEPYVDVEPEINYEFPVTSRQPVTAHELANLLMETRAEREEAERELANLERKEQKGKGKRQIKNVRRRK